MEQVTLKNLKASQVSEALLRLEGEPYSLKNYPMFQAIFNSPHSRRLMKAGRQVSKTMTFAADMITNASITPFLPLLYTNASAAQTTSFSTSKLDPFLLQSPAVYEYLVNAKSTINNVFHKRFANLSEIRLSYFSESADRVRGTTAHLFYADEVQDMLIDALIDAEECLSAAADPRFMYAGTSKSVITPLEYFWTISTKKEWVIHCASCHKWNIPSLDNVGKHGIICKNCGKPLDTFQGQWLSFGEEDAKYDGFRIPQIILPLHCCHPRKWANLLQKLDDYPDYKIKNEIMGDPMGEGEQLITEEMLQGMCIPTLHMEDKKTAQNTDKARAVVAGIDWGGGGVAGTSRTTLSIYAVYPERQKFVKIFGKIYDSGEPTKHIEDIVRYIHRFHVTTVYGDHGGGNFALSQLSSLLPSVQVIPIMYTDQAAPYKWDETARRFTVGRTVMIDNFLLDIKKGRVQAMRWEDFKPFAMDFLNVKEEVLENDRGTGRRVWRRYPAKPDDCLHSSLYGWLAGRIISGMVDFTTG